jgi:hypothetical protein
VIIGGVNVGEIFNYGSGRSAYTGYQGTSIPNVRTYSGTKALNQTSITVTHSNNNGNIFDASGVWYGNRTTYPVWLYLDRPQPELTHTLYAQPKQDSEEQIIGYSLTGLDVPPLFGTDPFGSLNTNTTLHPTNPRTITCMWTNWDQFVVNISGYVSDSYLFDIAITEDSSPIATYMFASTVSRGYDPDQNKSFWVWTRNHEFYGGHTYDITFTYS